MSHEIVVQMRADCLKHTPMAPGEVNETPISGGITVHCTAGVTTHITHNAASDFPVGMLLTYTALNWQHYTGIVAGSGPGYVDLVDPVESDVESVLVNGTQGQIITVYENPQHLFATGHFAIADYAVRQLTAQGYDGTNGKPDVSQGTHVMLGDSWIAPGYLCNNLQAAWPSTVFINAGVNANKGDQMIARFATDVAAHNPDFVWILDGTNDAANNYTPETYAANMATLVQLTHDCGALPIIMTPAVGFDPPSTALLDQYEAGILATYDTDVPPPEPVPPPQITAFLPSGAVAIPYSLSLGIIGGASPFTWTVNAGALPTGLTLDATGTISGTPTIVGSYTFVVEVTDSQDQTDTQGCTLVIREMPSPEPSPTPGGTIPYLRIPAPPKDVGLIGAYEDQDNFVRDMVTVPAVFGYGGWYNGVYYPPPAPPVTPSPSASNRAPILTLDEIKLHCKIEPDQTDEDPALRTFEMAARLHAENYLRYKIDATVGENIRTALLMLIAHWYRNRETVSTGRTMQGIEMPLTFTALLALERDYPTY